MPVEKCQLNNKPGFRWGKTGKCYVYNPESKSSITIAKKKALDQGIAIGEYFREIMDRLRKLRHNR